MPALAEKIISSDIGRRMASGAFWSLTGTALGKFCILLAGIFCARILGQEGFGELGMVRSTIGMFIVMGSAGIGVTATRFISQYRESDKSYTAAIYTLSNKFALVVGIMIACILLCVSSPIAVYALHEPELQLSVQIGCLILLASILNAAQQGVLTGLEDFRSIAINTFIASIIEALLTTAGAWLWGVEGAIAGFGLGIIVLWLANLRSVRIDFMKAGIHPAGKMIGKECRHLLIDYCLPATLSALTVTPAFFLIRSMLVSDSGYNELAIYEAADQWKVIILFIPSAISNIALPILSSMNKQQTFERTLMANILLVGGIATLVAILISLLSAIIMPLYGSDFNNQLPLILLAVSTVFSSIATVIEMAIYSKDKMWPCLWMNLLWAILMVGCCYLLLQRGYGAAAPAWAVLISYLLKAAYMGVYIRMIHETD